MTTTNGTEKTAPKPLSKAERKRRAERRDARKYPNADFSQTNSDPEPGLSCAVPEGVTEYILVTLRRQMRTGRKVYGKLLAGKVQKAFENIGRQSAEELEAWINWVGRHRYELSSGKYAPGEVADIPIKAAVDAAPLGVSNTVPAERSEPSQAAPNHATSAPADVSMAREAAGVCSARSQNAALPNAPSNPSDTNHSQTGLERLTPRSPTSNGAKGKDMFAEVKASEHHTTNASAERGPSTGTNSATTSEPKMPAKAPFNGQKEGAFKANRLFGSIYLNKPLAEVVEHATTLAADKETFNEVLNRSPIHREYLNQAMQDLGVPLP